MPAKHFPTDQDLQQHPVVSQEAWIAARTELLKREKELTHLHEQLSADIRALPWVKVEKNYVFDTANGPKSLSDLFDDRTQLLVKHFMFGPEWRRTVSAAHLNATISTRRSSTFTTMMSPL